MIDDKILIEAAQKMLERAYAPYSGHPVGSALVATDGQMYVGCNVENAAYPLGTCAEAGAISAMVAAGGKHIDHIVVVGPGEHLCTPCGGCRQKIREFTGVKDTQITICGRDGSVLLETTIGELLPHSFGPENLSEVLA